MAFKLIPSLDGAAPAIQCGEEYQVLKAFFETELQEDTAFAQHLQDLTLSSDKTQSDLSGNLYSIMFYNNKFYIENLFDEQETFTGEKYFLARTLKRWRLLLDRN